MASGPIRAILTGVAPPPEPPTEPAGDRKAEPATHPSAEPVTIPTDDPERLAEGPRAGEANVRRNTDGH